MKTIIRAAAAASFLTLAIALPSIAAPDDYTFEPVAADVANGDSQEFAVRLIDKRSGEPVTGAVIFRTRLDMSPDGMGRMESKVEPITASEAEPGVYKFKADFTMAGRWLLTLEAKVQGEDATVPGQVVFTAKD